VIPGPAAGLSAIGVLAIGLEGIEPHLVPPSLLSLTPELAAEGVCLQPMSAFRCFPLGS
jgi:hypothetical protein